MCFNEIYKLFIFVLNILNSFICRKAREIQSGGLIVKDRDIVTKYGLDIGSGKRMLSRNSIGKRDLKTLTSKKVVGKGGKGERREFGA